MIHRRKQRLAALAGGLLGLMLGGCKADDSSLYSKVWTCDAQAKLNQCGTGHNGLPMTCFSASHLGGADFCTESCNPMVGSPDPDNYACLSSGALLNICRPDSSNPGCPAGFNCFRTSLDNMDKDTGLCIVMPVCTEDKECEGESPRQTCGASLLRSEYSSSLLAIDHLNCVQACQDYDAGPNPCPPGELCLKQQFQYSTNIPFFCVPTCNPDDPPCPPNYFCLHDAGPGYPYTCVPGIPGRRCSHSEDCIMGDCEELGGDIKICTFGCTHNSIYCNALSGTLGQFFCDLVNDPNGFCAARGPFAGEYCRDANDCGPNQVCSNFDPFNPTTPRSDVDRECHTLCTGPGTCATVAGVPFACQANVPSNECYPADFGIRCDEATETCMGDLKCLTVNTNVTSSVSDPTDMVSLCTQPCKDTYACEAYGLTIDGFCGNGMCQRRHRLGEACNSAEQCDSQNCGPQGTCQ